VFFFVRSLFVHCSSFDQAFHVVRMVVTVRARVKVIVVVVPRDCDASSRVRACAQVGARAWLPLTLSA